MNVSFLLLRKSLNTGWKRLLLMIGSVAVGIWIIFAFTAVFNALSDNTRYTFYSTALDQATDETENKEIDGVDPVYFSSEVDSWRNTDIRIYSIEKTGDNTPDMVGLKVPEQGEYYVSPALDKLIKEHPEDNIGSRYGDKQIGILPEKLVSGRDVLTVIRGAKASGYYGDNESRKAGKGLVYSFTTESHIQLTGADLVLQYVVYMGVLIVLLPIIMLVSISAKLGSVQREKRYAALRLVGATNKQIINIMAVESLVSAVIGIAVGSLLYVASLPLIQQFTLEETRYWPSQIVVTNTQYIVITIITLLMVWLANWWGMRKVHTSPLGIAQNDRRETKPGWWRIIPLAAGIAVSIYVYSLGKAVNADEAQRSVLTIMLAIVLIMFGLVITGPWLTYILSKFGGKLSRKPTSMIGMKYVQMHARAISRSVIGVTLALFAGSFYLTATSGVNQLVSNGQNLNGYGIVDDKTAIVTTYLGELPGNSDPQENQQKVEQSLHQADYVHNIAKMKSFGGWAYGECKAVDSHIPKVDCGGNRYAAISWTSNQDNKYKIVYAQTTAELSKKIVSADDDSEVGGLDNITYDKLQNGADIADLEPMSAYYLVDIDSKDIDKLHTMVETAADKLSVNQLNGVMSNAEARSAIVNPQIEKLAQLAYGGMAVVLVVAIISIVVSTTGAILERKRSLYTLRLSGMQVSELKHMIMIESLAPLVVTSLIAAGLGIWLSYVFISTNGTTLSVTITPGYLAILIGSIILAAVAIYLVLPVLSKVTDPAENQTE
ncbi:MAG: ABC transporter permease [Candidatus Saccharibacteria bacterium]|nr:ABC transporter permease [Candidatus Saccharibacteria bacterium]